ncbi:DUF397 domain-containing protein [Sphaerisporangium sp. NPDC088356]|uniref:DUF397 domain-containing protein n=1 Tax=Sphaerisporangium sp. NPDC088356 TaxID=3154871 RepID=UPI003427F65D
MELLPPSLVWRKSTYSGSGDQCVEVALVGNASDAGVQALSVLLRDSKNPSGPVVAVTSGQWRAFVGGVKMGGWVDGIPA